MKTIKFLKIGVIFSLLFFLSQNLSAQNFILNDDNLIDLRAKNKINEIGTEVKNKLGISVYIYAKETLNLEENISTKEKVDFIKNYENKVIPTLTKPYVLLTLSVEDMYVNILYTDDLNKAVDKDDILDGYVVPLLASKDKNTRLAKVSASMLNGYSAIVDGLVEGHNEKIQSNISNKQEDTTEIEEVSIISNDQIGNQGKVASTIWRVFMYTLIVIGLALYTYAVLIKKK